MQRRPDCTTAPSWHCMERVRSAAPAQHSLSAPRLAARMQAPAKERTSASQLSFVRTLLQPHRSRREPLGCCVHIDRSEGIGALALVRPSALCSCPVAAESHHLDCVFLALGEEHRWRESPLRRVMAVQCRGPSRPPNRLKLLRYIRMRAFGLDCWPQFVLAADLRAECAPQGGVHIGMLVLCSFRITSA